MSLSSTDRSVVCGPLRTDLTAGNFGRADHEEAGGICYGEKRWRTASYVTLSRYSLSEFDEIDFPTITNY